MSSNTRAKLHAFLNSDLGIGSYSALHTSTTDSSFATLAKRDHITRSGGKVFSIKSGDFVVRDLQGTITSVLEGDPTTGNWASVTHDRATPDVKVGNKIQAH